MERRQFLRTAAAGVGAAALVPSLARAAGGAEADLEHRLERPGMTYRRLGRTNLNVSRIVHGSLYTNRQRIPLLARLCETGVNWFDTAWKYGGGRSEEAFGEFFSQGGRRNKVFISTKVDVRPQMKAGKGTYEAVMKQAETCLRRLRTDHVEILMLHGSTTLIDYVENAEWLRAADDLKKQGKIRFVGLSEHAKPAECLAKAAACGQYDMAMVAFSLIKATWGGLGRSDIKSMRPALDAAAKARMGIVVMKAAVEADRIVQGNADPRLHKEGWSPHQLCYRYVLDVPGVHSVVCGMTSMKHVDANVKVPTIAFAAADARRLERRAEAAGLCGFCGTCLDACPNGVAVQDVLRLHSYFRNGHRRAARSAYAAMPAWRRGDACRGCGVCEAACPAHLPIRRRLRDAHHALA